MNKREVKNQEITQLIHQMYESDPEHVVTFHETGNEGLQFCINRTIADYILNGVKVYALEDNNNLIAYFGEQNINNDRWLTGFMILPEMRKTMKSQVWNDIVNHFNGTLKVGLYIKNNPARKYLMKSGCKLIETKIHTYGPCEIFEYSNKECN